MTTIMFRSTDDTHDPRLRSWVASANNQATDFPIQNLPLGVFSRAGDGERRIGVAIGDQVLDLHACASGGLLHEITGPTAIACTERCLNALMALGPDAMRDLRALLSRVLREGSAAREAFARCLVPMSAVTMHVPAQIGDYTDFYASVYHATNVGSMFRPDNPLLPNYKFVPIGYHGRASSIVVSGTPVTRPLGQTKGDSDPVPVYGPSRRLDYECEVGAFIGVPNSLGNPVKIDDAERHLCGICLVNDWSARDVQTWEYQPLGPFLAKNFATTVSPWVVTMEALAPFRTNAFSRPAGDPAPIPYLSSSTDAESGGIQLQLEVGIRTADMRARGMAPHRVSGAPFTSMYWTFAQMLTHHASNGCNLKPGDLIASGTVSGPGRDERGCLLELAWRGTEPIDLPTGEKRSFLQDGDEVILRGWCERDGYRRIGLGECRGVVMPAPVV